MVSHKGNPATVRDKGKATNHNEIIKAQYNEIDTQGMIRHKQIHKETIGNEHN